MKGRHRTFASQLALALSMGALACGGVYACVNPADRWAAGVVWNNGEATNFAAIEALGAPGVNFTKEKSGDSAVYSFRSHYAPQKAMVMLGRFSISYQTGTMLPRLAVILDTTMNPDSFDFAAAVRVELDWLSDPALGAAPMAMAQRQLVQDSLRAWKHGDGQYWTKQRRVLAYNSWFSGDSVGGVWGVNGVRGCGLDAAFSLPPQGLPVAPDQPVYYEDWLNDSGCAGFAIVNNATGARRCVAAVRELDGGYYLLVMSRWPSFAGKLLHGYFDRDAAVAWQGNDTVFVITGIVGDRTGIRGRAIPIAYVKKHPRVRLSVMQGRSCGYGITVDGRSVTDLRLRRAANGAHPRPAVVDAAR
jgi:hypothetical protein